VEEAQVSERGTSSSMYFTRNERERGQRGNEGQSQVKGGWGGSTPKCETRERPRGGKNRTRAGITGRVATLFVSELRRSEKRGRKSNKLGGFRRAILPETALEDEKSRGPVQRSQALIFRGKEGGKGRGGKKRKISKPKAQGDDRGPCSIKKTAG